MRRVRPDNEEIADALERLADLLEAQGANAYRVRAYRNAAETARTHAPPLAGILEAEDTAGLERLPGIGKSIAALIREFVETRRVALLDRLEGLVSPEDLFTTVPGIGEEFAHRIHRELGIETLEALELASHDGRLASVPGIGERRVRGVRDSLAGILGRSGRRRARRLQWLEQRGRPRGAAADADAERPAVATLLAVDEEYRRRAATGELRTITPRRFNPRGEAWLPVLHVEAEDWSFTALYSNTARAHALGKTRDWMVVYSERDGEEDQCTVVTERSGRLAGRRVVRGREPECVRYYASAAQRERPGVTSPASPSP